MIVLENISIYKFKKMNFDDFMEWFDWRFNYGLNSTSSNQRQDDILSIVLLYDQRILKATNFDLNKIYPIYPWKNEIVKEVNTGGYDLYQTEIIKLKKKIKELEDLLDKNKKT